MNAAKEAEQVGSGGSQSHSGGSTEDPDADSPNQPKSRSSPEFLGLSRCAACYNERLMHRRGGDGESSSSAEDSGPEVDSESESEAESSSSSSSRFSEEAPPEILENPSSESGDAAEPEPEPEPEPAGTGGDGRDEAEEGREDKSRTKGLTQRAPLVKSSSLPSCFSPHLSPLTLLPRPHTVVSTLHLQVLSEKQDDDDDDDAFCIVKQRLSEREEQKTNETNGGGYMPPLQTGTHWQHPTPQQHPLWYQQQPPQPSLYHQQQQQQPQNFPPLSAQGQRLTPPLHALPGFHPPALYTHPPQAANAPQTHLHALSQQPCWYCFPPSPYWSHYSDGQFPQ